MSEPRESYHHGDLRRALIEATLAILGERGADSFTLREAARRAGVNHRAVYRHFADKETLLAAVAEQGYLELVARMRRAQSEAAPNLEAELHALALAYVTFALEQPAAWGVMTGPRLNEDGRFPGLEAAVTSGYRLMSALIERAKQERGYRGRVDHGVLSLWATVQGVALLTVQGRVSVPPDRVAKFTHKLLDPTIRGLLS